MLIVTFNEERIMAKGHIIVRGYGDETEWVQVTVGEEFVWTWCRDDATRFCSSFMAEGFMEEHSLVDASVQ